MRALVWRSRWAIWALFAAVLVRIALPGIVSAAGGGERVVVLARDVKAGVQLTPADLRLANVPANVSPDGALTSLDASVGALPQADLPAGLVLDQSLLGEGRPLADLPSGQVAVAVRLSDAGLAAMLSAGDRIDVMASPGGGASGSIAPAQRLAESALILEVPGRAVATGGGLGSALTPVSADDQDGLLLVAVTPDEAALIGGASSWAVITAVLVPNP